MMEVLQGLFWRTIIVTESACRNLLIPNLTHKKCVTIILMVSTKSSIGLYPCPLGLASKKHSEAPSPGYSSSIVGHALTAAFFFPFLSGLGGKVKSIAHVR